MRNTLYILIVGLLAFSACKKEPEPIDRRALAFEQYGKDTLIIRKFIADNNIPAVKDSVFDVYYQIIEPGTGTVVPTRNSIVTVAYKGRLLNGTVFDESTSLRFTLGNLITGWQLGLPKIKEGGKIRLLIPSGYAYGPQANGRIPANSVLDFDIELKKLE